MMSETITVSNGQEFLRIESADLDEALNDGFYRPFERGQTIVGNGSLVFEIPIDNLPSAAEDGLRELVAEERQAWSRQRSSGTSASSSLVATAQPKDIQPSSSDLLLTGLSQSELEEQERRERDEQELSEATGWRWYALWMKLGYEARRVTLLRQLRGSGVSALIHVALLMILASLILKTNDEPKGLVLTASPASETVIEEVIIEPTPLEITEPTESTESEAAAESEVVKTEAVATPDFMGAIKGDAVKPPARPASSGTERARPLKRASFFGKRVAAVNYVFVIDNSNSMTGGRFETALNELIIAVNQLTPKQRFYVLFYSDTFYPMFHPTPAQQLLPATPRNKELLRRWLGTVQLCLKTNGKEAIAAAFALKPDVIFVLGDGAFTDRASAHFAAMPQNRIPLHTLGMEVKPKDAVAFAKLAQTNGGTYKDVGVAPGARELSKKNPRPRNNVRGPVWGLKLKPKGK